MLQRVLDKISPEPNSGCWLWDGSLNSKGYGSFGLNGSGYLVHRYVYEQLKGAIPEGLEIDHLCRNRACCNPDHLEAVTHQENVIRGAVIETNKARGKSRTHCKRGHEYTAENTMISGYRRCKECHKIDKANYAAKYPDRVRAQNRQSVAAYRSRKELT